MANPKPPDKASNYLSRDGQFISKIEEILEERFCDEHFGVDDLARAMAISRIQLYRKLHKLTGKNISQYIRENRLERAMELLKADAASVSEIAYRVGFSSPAYFIKCFHNFYGFSPGEVLKKRGQKDVKTDIDAVEKEGENQISTNNNWTFRLRTHLKWIVTGTFILITLLIFDYFLVNLNSLRTGTEKEKTIAVLPFWNDSPDLENDYFCSGMEEEIRTQLMKIADLKIKGRQPVEQYRNEIRKDLATIGSELKVSYIITGSVSKIADNIRISVRLYEASVEKLIWTNTYAGKYTRELLAFQNENAIQIAMEVNGIINPIETERIRKDLHIEISAYDYAVRGQEDLRLYWRNLNEKHLKNAILFLDKALAIDSNCLRALLCKANVFSARRTMISRQYDSAIFYYEKAKKIDPYNPEIYMNLGDYYRHIRKIDLAIENLTFAIKLNPASFWAHVSLGRLYCDQKKDYHSGLPHLYQSLIVSDPILPETIFNVGMTFYNMQLYDKAEEYFSKALELHYGCMSITYYSFLYYNQGKFEAAIQFLDSICSTGDCNDQCDQQYFYNLIATENYREAAAYLRKMEESNVHNILLFPRLLLYKELNLSNERYDPQGYYNYLKKIWIEKTDYPNRPYLPLNLALACAVLEKKDEALRFLLEYEHQAGYIMEPWIKVHPVFKDLRENPDFKSIFKRAEIKRNKLMQEINLIEAMEGIDL